MYNFSLSLLPMPFAQAYLFRSQIISGLGLPSALQVKYTVFPEVTSTSWGSDVILGLSKSTIKCIRKSCLSKITKEWLILFIFFPCTLQNNAFHRCFKWKYLHAWSGLNTLFHPIALSLVIWYLILLHVKLKKNTFTNLYQTLEHSIYFKHTFWFTF